MDWVNVAVYFNNALSPILLLATVILLFFTWRTSKLELADTRRILGSQNKRDERVVCLAQLKEIAHDVLDTLNNREFFPSKGLAHIELELVYQSELNDMPAPLSEPAPELETIMNRLTLEHETLADLVSWQYSRIRKLRPPHKNEDIRYLEELLEQGVVDIELYSSSNLKIGYDTLPHMCFYLKQLGSPSDEGYPAGAYALQQYFTLPVLLYLRDIAKNQVETYRSEPKKSQMVKQYKELLDNLCDFLTEHSTM